MLHRMRPSKFITGLSYGLCYLQHDYNEGLSYRFEKIVFNGESIICCCVKPLFSVVFMSPSPLFSSTSPITILFFFFVIFSFLFLFVFFFFFFYLLFLLLLLLLLLLHHLLLPLLLLFLFFFFLPPSSSNFFLWRVSFYPKSFSIVWV